MRFLSALLLLLTLPGLLLPAGLRFRMCPCDRAGRAVAMAGACCSPSPAEIPVCCCQPGGTGERDDAGATPGARSHAPCKCPVLQVPERESAISATAPIEPLDRTPPAGIVAAHLSLRPMPDRLPGFAGAAPHPPPPDHARTLPLLL